MPTNARVHDVVAKLIPGGDGDLAHLSNSELLANTRGLVGKSNQVFAALLAHLAEVDTRGLHRTRACASLYTYCIYELRFSEDAAARRAGAAKLVKRFPPLLGAIANGELHLTGLLILGPHLTAENLIEVLARAKFRTKKELGKLVRELHPLPLVPDLVEPLRPLPASLRRPTWEQFVSAFSPRVRELPQGERPSDWANDVDDASDGREATGKHEVTPTAGSDAADGVVASEGASSVSATSSFPAPAREERPWLARPPVTGPQQYQVQFSTTEEHVQLIERAKGLMARQAPAKSLGELHLQALKLLVAALEKQRFATTERPRKNASASFPTVRAQPQPQAPTQQTASGRQSAGGEPMAEMAATGQEGPSEPPPRQRRQRGRHIPAEVRRAVFERDGGRCSYVDEGGERCRETHRLELHHRQPFGKQGPHTVENVTLHCTAHNALAAELDFGREHMAKWRDPLRHESLASEERAALRGLAATKAASRQSKM
jgi:hypothetical protein